MLLHVVTVNVLFLSRVNVGNEQLTKRTLEQYIANIDRQPDAIKDIKLRLR
jgi:hypothetical protein